MSGHENYVRGFGAIVGLGDNKMTSRQTEGRRAIALAVESRFSTGHAAWGPHNEAAGKPN